MKKLKYIILVIILLFILAIPIIFNNVKKDGDIENDIYTEDIENSQVNEEELEEIEKIKGEINAKADTNIYKIEEEYDGRKILQVKEEVQFNVDLAGIIKNDKPQEKELNELLKNSPINSGIWIAKQSRKEFLQLLKNNGIENFSITKEGYLKKEKNIENDIEKKLESMIESNKLYILNIKGIAYQRDYISGEIVEYPFEDMDPYQILEPYEKGNKIILEITTNKRNNLTNKEILENIIKY